MKKINMNFIPQNVAPIGAKRVVLFDTNGNEVTTLPLGGLAPKHQGNKLYSFGALSDVHLHYAQHNASSDFQEALTYFNNVANVDFICISGDMSDKGTDAEWLDYKSHVDTYSPNIPVHLSVGNHDTASDISYDYPIQYTGNPLWYSFEQNNDVFIMFGLRQWQGDNVFYNEALQWLYETLEENKDKRCFVFQHEMRLDGCGNAHGLYGWDGLAGRNGQVFLSLMEHYKNVIWFHGHSHTPFRLQSTQPTPIANYDRLHGCHSVHIPSLASPRYGNSDVIFDAEGYVVDVYENGIHLRGIDFIEKEFVPIASYWIDTTPVEIPENSYEDTRGVITKKEISLPKGSELFMNQRYSYSGKGLVTDEVTPPMFTAIIPVMPNTNYVLKIKNSNIEIPSASSSVVYGIDSSKMPAQQINGSGNIPSMTTGITLSEDKKSADITFTTAGNVSYIALSLKALDSGTLKESDITDYIIELEQNGNIPEGTEIKVNTQFSETDGGFKERPGYIAFVIPVEPETSYKFNIDNIASRNLNSDTATMYELTADKTFNSRINGSKYIHSMTNTVISEDYTSAEVNFVTTSNVGYIAVSISLGDVNPDNIKITLEKTDMDDFNNVYDEPHWFNNYIASDTGNLATDSNTKNIYATTAFISYNANKTYTFVLPDTTDQTRIFYYDSNKSFISSTTQSTELTHIIDSVPNGTVYFRFRTRTTTEVSDYETFIANITCTITQRPTYNVTNIVPTAESVDSTAPFDGVGYRNNAYMSSSTNVEATYNGFVLTGLIPITVTEASAPTIYVRGVTIDTSNSYTRLSIYDSNKQIKATHHSTNIAQYYKTEELGDKYYKLTPAYAASTGNTRLSGYGTGTLYIRFSFTGVGENLVMTLNQPIQCFSTDLLETCDVKLNKRWSASSNAYVDQVGQIAFSVPYSEIEGRTLRLIGFECKTSDGSAWYAYNSSGTLLGRIAQNGSGVVWDSSALIDNGDGSYDIPISPEIFIVSGSTKPLTETPATVYITMRVDESKITSIGDCKMLVSDLS